MRASLDTNVIIHLYRAKMQHILFEIFDDGLFIYEQIRNVELKKHGKTVLDAVDNDISQGKMELYTDSKLKEQGVYKLFEFNVKENRLLYGAGDFGEVCAISLAQTIGAYSLVTNDTKQGGPYMSLMQFEHDVKPFNFTDILILRFLLGIVDEHQTVADFDTINNASDLNWSMKSQLVKFIKRFCTDPYSDEEKRWFENWSKKNGINPIVKFRALRNAIIE